MDSSLTPMWHGRFLSALGIEEFRCLVSPNRNGDPPEHYTHRAWPYRLIYVEHQARVATYTRIESLGPEEDPISPGYVPEWAEPLAEVPR